MNIQPISELRNYNSLLDEVKEGQPVYLTKNGKGVYAIVDIKGIEEYQRVLAFANLLTELQKGEKSGYVDEKTFVERFDI